VRGPFLNPWEMQNYDFDGITYIGSTPHFYEFSDKRAVFPRMYHNPLIRAAGLGYFMPSLKKILRDFDVVHSVEAYHSMSLMAARTSGKFVFTQWETLPDFGSYLYPPKKLISKHVIKKADLIHAVTRRAADCVIKLGATPSKVFVKPYGVDPKKFRPDAEPKYRRRFLSGGGGAVILFIGRIVEEKGVPVLLDAYKNLKSKARLVLCGSGPVKTPNDVIRIDTLPYHEVPFLHASADVLCLPSVPHKKWEEQFGFVLVEAMASGKPVVATNSGAIPEIVEDQKNGFLVPPGNSKKLRDALEHLIENESERKKIGIRNRKKALERFNAKNFSAEIRKKYESIL